MAPITANGFRSGATLVEALARGRVYLGLFMVVPTAVVGGVCGGVIQLWEVAQTRVDGRRKR